MYTVGYRQRGQHAILRCNYIARYFDIAISTTWSRAQSKLCCNETCCNVASVVGADSAGAGLLLVYRHAVSLQGFVHQSIQVKPLLFE